MPKSTSIRAHRFKSNTDIASTAEARRYWIGRRVQLPAWHDRWMRGDRYGTVVGATKNRYDGAVITSVRLDKSDKTIKINAAALSEVY